MIIFLEIMRNSALVLVGLTVLALFFSVLGKWLIDNTEEPGPH